MTDPIYADDRVCQCGHPFGRHCGICRTPAPECNERDCRCVAFRPRVFASHRQLTGTPYIHHAYVYDGNKVVMACSHQHGERRSHNPITGEVKNQGAVTAQACANRMLRKYLNRTRKVAVLPSGSALLKTINNERDAKETIRRLKEKT